MATPPDMQAQLRSLAIPKDQRPTARARAGGSSRAKWLAGLVVVLAVGSLAYGYRQQLRAVVGRLAAGAAAPGEVRLIRVTAGADPAPTAVLTATGKIVSDHHVSVATKVSGQIVSLFFEQGDRVEEGQLLARVEDVLYRARRDEAAGQLQRAEANLAYQKINLERVAGLVKQESAPSIEYADAVRARDEADALVESLRAALAFAEKQLKDCEVLAPIAGVILQRNVEVGDFVAAEGGRGANANAQFGEIADMTKLRVEVDISELDIIRVRKEMPCLIIPDAYKDRRYTGYVMWIDPGANYSKATVQVKVRIEDPDPYLRVEGSAQVSMLSEHPKPEPAGSGGQTIWIPASAVRFDSAGGDPSVFVAVDGRLVRTPITIGRRNGDRVEVGFGLTAGQSIVADGVTGISDGQPIKP